MSNSIRAWLACIAGALLSSCAGLYVVHDPQTGIITAGQVPGFIKSVKCELITFYEIERLRRILWDATAPTDVDRARYAYFELANDLYGLFTLELKVTDSAGLGTGTLLDVKNAQDAAHSIVWEAGPGFGGQGIHDLSWSFLMRQDLALALSPTREGRVTDCFKGPMVKNLQNVEALAEAYPASDQAQFTRITVDGLTPLAAWLRDNGAKISSVYLDPVKPSERADPVQMYFQFQVQVTLGASAKYSLVNTHWSPLAIQGTASTVQNSYLTIYINGDGAVLANTAKSGAATTVRSGPALGTINNPIYVRARPAGNGAKTQSFTPDGSPTVSAPRSRRPGHPRTLDKGSILAPIPATPPTTSQ